MFRRITAFFLLSCAAVFADGIVIRQLEAEVVSDTAGMGWTLPAPEANAVGTLDESGDGVALIELDAGDNSAKIRAVIYNNLDPKNMRIIDDDEIEHPFDDVFNTRFDAGGVRAFTLHPDLPFGVVAGRDAGELFALSWYTDSDEALIDFKPVLESLGIGGSNFVCPTFSPDGKWLVVGIGVSRSPRFIAFPVDGDYPFVNLREVVSLGAVSGIMSIAWSPEPLSFIVAADGELLRWNMDNAADAGMIIALPPAAAAGRKENPIETLFSNREYTIDEAIDFLLAQVIDSLSDHEEAIEIAFELFEVEEYNGAIALFGKALEFNPPPAHAAIAHNGLGLAYMMAGNAAKAVENYDLATKLDPGNAFTYNNRAMLLAYYTGDLKKALKEVNIALRLERGEDAIYDTRAQIYLFMGKHRRAAKDFRQVKAMSQRELDYFLEEGVNFFSSMILRDSAGADGYAYRGVIHILLREFDKARADFETALKLNPKHRIAGRYRKHAAREKDIINIRGRKR